MLSKAYDVIPDNCRRRSRHIHTTALHRCGLLQQISYVARSVCLSACLSDYLSVGRTGEPGKRMNRSSCRFGVDSPVPRGPCTKRGSRSLHGTGQFSRVVPPIEKHWKSLLRYTQQKGTIQSSITALNNGTICHAAVSNFRDHSFILLHTIVCYAFCLTSCLLHDLKTVAELTDSLYIIVTY